MDWTVYVFGSGLAFFIGIGCTLVGLAASLGRGRVWPRVSAIAVLLGPALILLSGAPLPIWFYVTAILLAAGWLIVAGLGPKVPSRWAGGFRLVVALFWIGGAAVELPYQWLPTIPAVGTRHLYLFADSLAAGLTQDQTNNWPALLARQHDLKLVNYARPGATVATALGLANDASLGDGLVLLEIGGNDLLGSTSDAAFDRDLRELLQRVCGAGRVAVMFELPIPPLENEFGRTQRRLAAEYHVLLIPKRVLVDVIARDGHTLDSIHLSPRGHQRMAETVWQVIRPAYDP